MKHVMTAAVPLMLAATAFAQAGAGAATAAGASDMVIAHAGSQPSASGPAQNFTGSARIDPLFAPHAPSTMAGAAVTFEPGARSAWHTHPAGQVLVVTAGVGRIQQWGGPVREIRPGDVIWTPPGVQHWHGAAPATAMMHIALQEVRDGVAVQWMEKVADADYLRPVSAGSAQDR